jgi:hypothetical protein
MTRQRWLVPALFVATAACAADEGVQNTVPIAPTPAGRGGFVIEGVPIAGADDHAATRAHASKLLTCPAEQLKATGHLVDRGLTLIFVDGCGQRAVYGFSQRDPRKLYLVSRFSTAPSE